MKYLKITLLLFLIVLFACSEGGDKEEQENQNDSTQSENSEETSTSDEPRKGEKTGALGYYTGIFIPIEFDSQSDVYHANKITISIDSLDERNKLMYGHSIVAGNLRNFSGKYIPSDSGLVATVEEPGDAPYDGYFNFTVLPNGEKLVGTWHAYEENFSTVSTKYSLEKKEFQYDPDIELPEGIGWAKLYDAANAQEFLSPSGEFLTEDVLTLNASNTKLKTKDVENMHRGDLEVIRNSIYAKHGYSFANRKMRFVFDKVDWYMPVSIDVRADLTDLEKENIELINRYEKHAEAYYDSFGR